MARDLTIPVSIVLGGALIGGGLYFGLRDGTPASLPPTAILASTSPAPGTPPTAAQANPPITPPATPAAPLDAEDRKRFEAEVNKAIAGLKPEWKKKCWDPAVKATAEPKTSKYTLNLSFSAEGKTVGVGWSELRDVPSRADVAQCLRQELVSVTATPPGAPTGVELPVEFP